MTNVNTHSFLHALRSSRILVEKGETPIANLSLLFCLIAALCAPHLALGSVIAALALGYRITLPERSGSNA